ncbi:hypothetical protein PR003_g24702 [Phytophthora rubi]|uniref:Glycosyltransferase 61 catalytic domain-containing protein n=1 Tax=Phytophthora rubi TaxID=129364 RepID=A0A6A3II85_9STRA|nr:hypothetical protein PR002_g23869 [Phytophthora rubi]KAE8982900.1 hypothetical protein PR001_g23597 [Phytophthora rubi]KAE9292671.1 hypothetical protein PR003_g24702 [Phytophthora rubi]
MSALPAFRKKTDKASSRLTSSFRDRRWVWGGLLVSVAMMLLGNFLVVKASLNSFELAKSKVRTRIVMQGDIEASVVNVILRSEDDVGIVTNATAEDSGQVTTITDGSATKNPEVTTTTTYSTTQHEDLVTPTGTTQRSDGGAATVDTVVSSEANTKKSFSQATTIREKESKDVPTVEDADASIGRSEGEGADPLVDTEELHATPSPTITNTSSNMGTPTPSGVLQLHDECFALLDYGLVEVLRSSSSSFCSDGSNSSPYTFYHIPDAEFSATQLDNVVLDMRGAQVSRDINSVAQDGGEHDPRFRYKPNAVFCSCGDPQDASHGAPNIWMHLLAEAPTTTNFMCQTLTSEMTNNTLNLDRAVVLARKDDHNPFFQISGILNAWVMMKVLGWDSSSTQLVTLDRALPSPVDDLRHAMLGPDRPVIGGDELQKHVVHFNTALLTPYEARGPMMSHLNDDQPCYANEMMRDFRDEALRTMKVGAHKTDPKRCLVTVISRRPYGGRRIQRVWRNEDEILSQMRSDYKFAYRFGECEFQSLDFVNMTMHDQMQIMVDSDVVIGMHGAGMVNVMWTRPETLVVEIFPLRRWRWGYRNLCQYLGCSWREFRGGSDVFVRTTDPNGMDKFVFYQDWKIFFDPLFRETIANLEKSIES